MIYWAYLSASVLVDTHLTQPTPVDASIWMSAQLTTVTVSTSVTMRKAAIVAVVTRVIKWWLPILLVVKTSTNALVESTAVHTIASTLRVASSVPAPGVTYSNSTRRLAKPRLGLLPSPRSAHPSLDLNMAS